MQYVSDLANTETAPKQIQFNLRISKFCKLLLNTEMQFFSSLLDQKESKKVGDPHTGDPKSSKPLLSGLIRFIA